MALGEYPAEYDRRIHGPYDPSRYYGKPDTKFGQVKLGELSAWLGRRNKSPTAIVSAVSRAWWRWQHRYIMPWNAGIGGPMQFLVGTMLFFYVINYPKYRTHRQYKYHW